MERKISYTNTPHWREMSVKSKLPDALSSLDHITHNLWWIWNPEATDLFQAISPELWVQTKGNPVLMLEMLNYARLEEIAQDAELMQKVEEVNAAFTQYMAQEPNRDRASVAYFSMEYGLANCLKIFSGGLGVLAGDYLKEASDSNVDMVAVGFLYRYGYFTQSLSIDGRQEAHYEAQNFNQLPIHQVMDEQDHPLILEVPFIDRTVYASVWRVDVGRVPLYLMDTDVESNSEFDRSITYQLYGGDWENRMKQEYLLGVGGIHLLDKLQIKKEVYHCNEGHAALINAQRLANHIEQGLSFEEALEVVRASSLYTVHTPVPAGHDSFDETLFGKYMGHFPEKLQLGWNELMNLGRENPDTHEKFSMSVFACNTCQEVNGVSWLHGKVSQQMFQPIWKGYMADELHVGYVTNGVHMPTWTATEWKTVYKEIFGEDFVDRQDDPTMWQAIKEMDDAALWDVRTTLKEKLVYYVKGEIREKLHQKQTDPTQILHTIDNINPKALLIGFARRFATYKRAHLLFTDLERLAQIVNNPDRPVQFIFAGKAHPADGGGQELIRRIVEISRRPEFLGKILFVENYDMQVAKRLISGVDIWMNTPTRPLEASGTSGEKALMNGVLNFSVLDGWWYEGYTPGAGWALTDKRTYQDQGHQDQLDAETIYSTFENEIIPLYFKLNEHGYSPDWVACIKKSISEIAPRFTMKRMLNDYYSKFYQSERDRSKSLQEDNFAKAKEIALWKKNVVANWDAIEVKEVDVPEALQAHPTVGEQYVVRVCIDRKETMSNLGVELVVCNPSDPEHHSFEVHEMEVVRTEGSLTYYELRYTLTQAGVFKLAFRMYPKNPDLPHRQDFAYVYWF